MWVEAWGLRLSNKWPFHLWSIYLGTGQRCCNFYNPQLMSLSSLTHSAPSPIGNLPLSHLTPVFWNNPQSFLQTHTCPKLPSDNEHMKDQKSGKVFVNKACKIVKLTGERRDFYFAVLWVESFLPLFHSYLFYISEVGSAFHPLIQNWKRFWYEHKRKLQPIFPKTN
jgi:hypothetical protein